MNRKIILFLFLSLSLTGFTQLAKPISPKLTQMQKEFNGIWYIYDGDLYYNKVNFYVDSEKDVKITLLKDSRNYGGKIKVLFFDGKRLKINLIYGNGYNQIDELIFKKGKFESLDAANEITRYDPL